MLPEGEFSPAFPVSESSDIIMITAQSTIPVTALARAEGSVYGRTLHERVDPTTSGGHRLCRFLTIWMQTF